MYNKSKSLQREEKEYFHATHNTSSWFGVSSKLEWWTHSIQKNLDSNENYFQTIENEVSNISGIRVAISVSIRETWNMFPEKIVLLSYQILNYKSVGSCFKFFSKLNIVLELGW